MTLYDAHVYNSYHEYRRRDDPMLIDYSDIWSRMPAAPLWWFQGVPRYEPFHPQWLEGSEAALVQSVCQICSTEFIVGVCSPYSHHRSLSGEIQKDNTLWLSDPPRVFCCQGGAGHASSSLAIEVLEFWKRGSGDNYRTWSRVPEFEKKLSDWYPELSPKPLPIDLLLKTTVVQHVEKRQRRSWMNLISWWRR